MIVNYSPAAHRPERPAPLATPSQGPGQQDHVTNLPGGTSLAWVTELANSKADGYSSARATLAPLWPWSLSVGRGLYPRQLG